MYRSRLHGKDLSTHHHVVISLVSAALYLYLYSYSLGIFIVALEGFIGM